MKNIIFITLIFTCLFCYSQNKDKKETIYLLFDINSKENCTIEVEGKGYVKKNKFRKERQGEFIIFKICDESFSAHKSKSIKDTCSIKALDNLKVVSLDYINKKKSKTILKYNPFDEIYIIEKISDNKIIKYEVAWIDDWIMIDD